MSQRKSADVVQAWKGPVVYLCNGSAHQPCHWEKVLSIMDHVMCAKETSMMILVSLVVPGKQMTQNFSIFCLPAEIFSQKEGANPHKDKVRGYGSD